MALLDFSTNGGNGPLTVRKLREALAQVDLPDTATVGVSVGIFGGDPRLLTITWTTETPHLAS